MSRAVNTRNRSSWVIKRHNMNSFIRYFIDSQLTNIHSGVRRKVKTINQVEIPSTPSRVHSKRLVFTVTLKGVSSSIDIMSKPRAQLRALCLSLRCACLLVVATSNMANRRVSRIICTRYRWEVER